MSKRILLVVVVMLLGSVVSYLAIDRHEKDDAKQQTKSFKDIYLK